MDKASMKLNNIEEFKYLWALISKFFFATARALDAYLPLHIEMVPITGMQFEHAPLTVLLCKD